MAEKKFQGAPFGTQTARFDVSGIHPKSKIPGSFTQTPYCKKATSGVSAMLGPGRYDVDYGGFSSKAVEERALGPGWARSYEVSRTAALPHLLHKEQWELKRSLKRKVGPGSYEIKDFLEMADEKPCSTRGIIQTKESRFREKLSRNTPGPGTYGEGGIPQAAIEQKEKKSASTVGLLDSGSSASRSLPMVGSRLGPGSYSFDSSTQQMAKKITSIRGPYDLYSGDRNKPIKTGHFAAPLHTNLGPGQYGMKSFLDELDTQHKKRHGKFGKVEQHPENPKDRIYCFTLSQCPRDPVDPGPGHYDPRINDKPLSQANRSPGFLSSAQRSDKLATKFFTGNFNPVGPGRYDIQKWEDVQRPNGHSSAFKSKTGKPNAQQISFLQERIRGKDLRPEDRVFLVQPDHPSDSMLRTKTHLDRSTPQVQFDGKRTLTVA